MKDLLDTQSEPSDDDRSNFPSVVSHHRLSTALDRLLIISLLAIIATLEFSTPPNYVCGYLYVGGILFANSRIGKTATLQVTLTAVFLTMINIWFPQGEIADVSIVVNRLVAAISLIITGWLSEKNRLHQSAIAEQKYQLQAQAELVGLREDFAATLTHDLKTPLLGAIDAIKILQSHQLGGLSELQQQVLTAMSRAHQTSLRLVETLLDVYRNDAEGLKLNLAPVDLTILVGEVTQELAAIAGSVPVYLSLNYGASDFRQSLWVNGDAFQLKRVLTNLITNAIEHSRHGDRVEIVLASQPNYRVVRIIDRGSGITPAELPSLFTRFYQGHSNRQAKGTGLGLYLCRQIVTAHGGIIWAENPAGRSERGAIFAFRLPLYPPTFV